MLSQPINSQNFENIKTENSCVESLHKSPTTMDLEHDLVEFRPYLKKFDSEAEDVNMKMN